TFLISNQQCFRIRDIVKLIQTIYIPEKSYKSRDLPNQLFQKKPHLCRDTEISNTGTETETMNPCNHLRIRFQLLHQRIYFSDISFLGKIKLVCLYISGKCLLKRGLFCGTDGQKCNFLRCQ